MKIIATVWFVFAALMLAVGLTPGSVSLSRPFHHACVMLDPPTDLEAWKQNRE